MINLKDIKKGKWIGLFLVFSVIYFMIDNLNLNYNEMIKEFGLWLVLVNVILNLIMSALSSYMVVLSDKVLNEKGIKTKGDSMSIISILFGILTYGCTPCVISFLAVFGISFSVIALPFAGLPYKFISLALILLGIWILNRELKRNNCSVKF